MTKFLSLISVCLIMLVMPIPIAAHSLQSDSDIGAVIHIDPDDDPIIGQPSNIYIEINSTSQIFSPETCECILQISSASSATFNTVIELQNQSLKTNVAQVTYIFPRAGEYKLTLIGNPRGNSDPSLAKLDPFKLEFEFKVARDSEQANQNRLFGIVIILVSAIAAGLGVYLIYVHSRQQNH